MSKNWKTYAVKKGKESTSHSKHREGLRQNNILFNKQ